MATNSIVVKAKEKAGVMSPEVTKPLSVSVHFIQSIAQEVVKLKDRAHVADKD